MVAREKNFLLGESSWDLLCANEIGLNVDGSFLHNDFFKKSNILMNGKFNRIVTFIECIYFSCLSIVKREKIYYSSFNFEVIVVAYLFCFYKKAYLFCPNVLANPDGKKGLAFKRLKKLFQVYSGKIIVSDEVTLTSLLKYKPILLKKKFKLVSPPKDKVKETFFIVVLPAVLSHNDTKIKKNSVYQNVEYIISWLILNELNYAILPHPREEGKLETELKGDFIKSCDISKKGKEICYISNYSSLSLNRRYGGLYGVWVKEVGERILPIGIDDSFQINLEELI